MTEAFFEKLKREDEIFIKRVQRKYREKIESNSIPNTLSMPLGIQLELTKGCNLKCRHCYNNSMKKDEKELSIEEWKIFAHHIVECGGVFQVTISGGEPLILGGNNIYELMDIFHNDGSNFVFITNGTLLTREIIKKLSKFSYLWFQVSIDSASPERHDYLRGVKGAWEKAVKGAIMVSQQNIPLKIASCITPEELPYVEDLVKLSIAVGASSLIVGDIMPSGRALQNTSLLLNNKEKKKLHIKLKKLQRKYYEKIKIETIFSLKTQLRYASIGNIEGCIIRPNGDVRLDCVAPFIIGNIRKKDFCEMWEKIQPTIWTHNKVQEFIESVNYISGFSSMINNYLEEDINLDIGG